MDLPAVDFPTLARRCAPDVHISTLAAVVRHESAFNPLVIGVNSKPHRSIRPSSRSEAVEEVRRLIDKGVNFDVGYGQINVRNWKWLGVTADTIFDPCVNLASAQRVLVACYERATKQIGPGQRALYAAFSCYNTGNLTDGFRNGYVGKVLAGAGIAVPAIGGAPRIASPQSASDSEPKNAARAPRADAFRQSRPDVFVNTRQGAFNKPKAPVFGVPIARPDRDSR